MIKLVASDFDGTLLPYGQNELSPEAYKMISNLLLDGCSFTVSSGRVHTEIASHFSSFSDRIFITSSDGALLVKGDKTIYHCPFSFDAVAYAINVSKSKNIPIRLFSKDRVYSTRVKTNVPSDVVVDKYHEIKEHVYKIISYGECIEGFFAYARSHYSDEGLTEYVPLYANKGLALGALQRHLGVSYFETLAMGDRANDIPMMKNAKFKVCVGDRSFELNKECDIHTSDSVKILEKVWIGSDFCN